MGTGIVFGIFGEACRRDIEPNVIVSDEFHERSQNLSTNALTNPFDLYFIS
jgi:hypothetical protein